MGFEAAEDAAGTKSDPPPGDLEVVAVTGDRDSKREIVQGYLGRDVTLVLKGKEVEGHILGGCYTGTCFCFAHGGGWGPMERMGYDDVLSLIIKRKRVQ